MKVDIKDGSWIVKTVVYIESIKVPFKIVRIEFPQNFKRMQLKVEDFRNCVSTYLTDAMGCVREKEEWRERGGREREKH